MEKGRLRWKKGETCNVVKSAYKRPSFVGVMLLVDGEPMRGHAAVQTMSFRLGVEVYASGGINKCHTMTLQSIYSSTIVVLYIYLIILTFFRNWIGCHHFLTSSEVTFTYWPLGNNTYSKTEIITMTYRSHFITDHRN